MKTLNSKALKISDDPIRVGLALTGAQSYIEDKIRRSA